MIFCASVFKVFIMDDEAIEINVKKAVVTMIQKTQVLIVGAGPSGLMLAAQLIKHQVAFVLIDKKSALSDWHKASMISSRSLELFQQLGLLETVLAQGQRVDGFQIFEEQVCVIDSRYDEVSARFPFNVHLGQPLTEKVLLDHVLAHGHSLCWSHELVGYEQFDSHVEAVINTLNGQKQIHADFLVGADGASSFVRKQEQLAFKGETYPNYYIMGNVKLQSELRYNRAHVFFSKVGFLSIYPLHDCSFQVGGNIEVPDPDAFDVNKIPDAQELISLYQARYPFEGSIKQINRLNYYRTHARIVKAPWCKRVVVIGDAAHIVSPLTGLGMNTGMQDANHLAWRLALMYKASLPIHFLAAYSEERLFQLRRLVKVSNVLEAIFSVTRFGADAIRSHLVKSSQLYASVRKKEISVIMQKNLTYAGCHQFRDDGEDLLLRAGAQLPHVVLSDHTFLADYLHPTKHRLLLFLCEATSERVEQLLDELKSVVRDWQSWLSLCLIVKNKDDYDDMSDMGQVIEDKDGLIHCAFCVNDTPTFYFVRPDDYIAYASHPAVIEQLVDYVSFYLQAK